MIFYKYGLSLGEKAGELVGLFKGKVLVCASGHTLWSDLLKEGFDYKKYRQEFDIMAVNRVIQDLPGFINHGYSNHAEKLMYWRECRDDTLKASDRHYPESTLLHSNRESGNIDHVLWPWIGHGTSTLGAVIVAHALGYDEIVVCGAPMDCGPHYYDPPWIKPDFSANVRHWENAAKYFEGKVRAASGILQDVL